MMRRLGNPFIAIILLPLFLPVSVHAHKVNLFAYHEGGSVFTESYFSDGTPCRNSRITARDESGTVIARGVTDDEGLFSFAYEEGAVVRISLNAGDGHGAETTLRRKEASGEKLPEAVGGENPPAMEKSNERTVLNIDEEAVGRIMEEKIAPLRESISQVRKKMERPRLDKVIGGLGWIVGLAGAYLWGISRRREKG